MTFPGAACVIQGGNWTFAAILNRGSYAQIARFAKFGVTDCVGGVTGPLRTFAPGAADGRFQPLHDIHASPISPRYRDSKLKRLISLEFCMLIELS